MAEPGEAVVESPASRAPEYQLRHPFVSVLMLAYNHAPYLAEAIESVLMQETDFPFELLIGEDCSTDETRSIALSYQDKYPDIITVITSPENVGMHENHHRLVRSSRGTYIAYCEGDDFWNVPDKLARQVEYLERRPGYSAVHTGFAHLIRTGTGWRILPEFHGHRRGGLPQGSIFDALLVRNFVQTCTLMARSTLVKEYVASPISKHRFAVEDWPMCLFLSAHGDIGYIDAPTATYRRIEGSATNKGAAANLRRVDDQLRMATEVGEYFGTDQRIVQESHATTMRALVGNALLAGDVGRCRSALQWLSGHSRSPSVTLKLAAVRALLVIQGGPRAYRILARARASMIERVVYSDASREAPGHSAFGSNGHATLH